VSPTDGSDTRPSNRNLHPVHGSLPTSISSHLATVPDGGISVSRPSAPSNFTVCDMRLIGLIPAIYLASIPQLFRLYYWQTPTISPPTKESGYLSERGRKIRQGLCLVGLTLVGWADSGNLPKVIFGAENNFEPAVPITPLRLTASATAVVELLRSGSATMRKESGDAS
jgi:hypothetical protein